MLYPLYLLHEPRHVLLCVIIVLHITFILILFFSFPSHPMPFSFFFFFNDPAPTEISPLPLHDALPISLAGAPASGFRVWSWRAPGRGGGRGPAGASPGAVALAVQEQVVAGVDDPVQDRLADDGVGERSEEHTSELQSHLNLVCRLLL